MRLQTLSFALALLAPLAGAQADTTPPAFLAQPVVTLGANPAAPLTARVQLATDEPVIVEIFVREPARSFRFLATNTFATTHDLPLVGFRPGRTHRVNVAVRDAAGNRTAWGGGFVLTTPALPANFPPLNVTTSAPALMEPGVTLTGLRWSSPTLPGTGTYCVYLDAEGQVVWLYETPLGLRDVTRLRNGNLLIHANNRLAQEVDLFGTVVTQWYAARLGAAGAPPGAILVDCDSFHHELHELPAGEVADFIALSTELRTFPNYPASETDPTQTIPSANVVGDVVVEFRRDGSLVREYSTFENLDPYRLGYMSLAGIYNQLYGGVLTFDWSHGNAATVDPTDDTWVISLRHQDAVVKVRRSDHSIVWIHGPHDAWKARWQPFLLTPLGAPFEWQFHQHASRTSPDGVLTLFDNGNYRAVPPTPAPPTSQWYSRAVRFLVDPVAMTTTQVWEWRDSTPFFSGQFGDVDPLPLTGNQLVTDGAKQVPGLNKSYSRLVEVRSAGPGSQIVFEVIVNDPSLPVTSPYNWNLYRAERYSRPYPF
ncbi:MAG: aryl-sulfate sulfotransferase [Planctomycetes bacterium]|nr:aryl-sulfate sulfotransferase [Planctomycetota bacterium]